VTSWLQQGMSPAIVQKAMGHSDIRVTMGYTHLDDDDLDVLVETGANPGAVGGQTDAKPRKAEAVAR
jgi:integrase